MRTLIYLWNYHAEHLYWRAVGIVSKMCLPVVFWLIESAQTRYMHFPGHGFDGYIQIGMWQVPDVKAARWWLTNVDVRFWHLNIRRFGK